MTDPKITIVPPNLCDDEYLARHQFLINSVIE